LDGLLKGGYHVVVTVCRVALRVRAEPERAAGTCRR